MIQRKKLKFKKKMNYNLRLFFPMRITAVLMLFCGFPSQNVRRADAQIYTDLGPGAVNSMLKPPNESSGKRNLGRQKP